jgi:hypothetical protein
MASQNKGRKIGRVGKFEYLSIDRLTVLPEIQRIPTDQRIKELVVKWDDNRAGIFLVAKITDGPYAGTLHITNGGTRWRALNVRHADEEGTVYMPCHVAEMTMEEAAVEFLTENKDAKSPHFYYQYLVGVMAQDDTMLAIEAALSTCGLDAGKSSSYGNGVPGVMAALKACERIIEGYVKTGDSYDDASDKLADIIERCREAYTDKSAHSADLIQAVNRLVFMNKTKLNAKAGRERLIKTLSKASVDAWNTEATNARKFGGSESRATYMAYFIGREYNKRLAVSKKIDVPKFTPVEAPPSMEEAA